MKSASLEGHSFYPDGSELSAVHLIPGQKVCCMAVSKPNSLPYWIHLNKVWCLKFLSAKVKPYSLCSH